MVTSTKSPTTQYAALAAASIVALGGGMQQAHAFSSGIEVNFGSCDVEVIASKVGCVTGWEYANVARTDPRSECLDEVHRVMHWAKEAVRGDRFTMRTADTDTPELDPLTWAPGELVPLYVRSNDVDGQYRGLIASAVLTADRTPVGTWELPSGADSFFQTYPCPNPDAEYVVHNSGTAKPYLSMLYWRAPDTPGIGDITIDALIKRGFANTGDFHFPNPVPLVLKERGKSPIVWRQGDAGENCVTVCNKFGSYCVAEGMANIRSEQDFVERSSHTLTCQQPVRKSCSENDLKVEGEECYWTNNVNVLTVCEATTDSETTRICACNSSNWLRPDMIVLVLAAFVSIAMAADVSSFTTAAMAAMSVMIPGAEAHNWQETFARAMTAASTTRPCLPRKVGEVHAQVNPGKHNVMIQWATGHDRDHYVLLIHNDHYEKLKWRNITTLMNDYLDAAPAGEFNLPGGIYNQDATGAYMHQRYHTRKNTRESNKQNFATSLLNDWTHLRNYTGTDEETFLSTTVQDYNVFGTFVRSLEANANLNHNVNLLYDQTKLGSDGNPDRLAAYQSEVEGYEFIELVMRFTNVVDRGGDFDGVLVPMPSHLRAGHHVLHWKWSGFGDCTDVNVHTEAETPITAEAVYGVRNEQDGWKYERVNNCNYNYETIVTPAFYMENDDISVCIDSVEEYLRKLGQSSAYDITNPTFPVMSTTTRRYGIQVRPMSVPDHVIGSRGGVPFGNGELALSDLLISRPASNPDENDRGFYDNSMMENWNYVAKKGERCIPHKQWYHTATDSAWPKTTLREAVLRCGDWSNNGKRQANIDIRTITNREDVPCTGFMVNMTNFVDVVSTFDFDREYNIIPCMDDASDLPVDWVASDEYTVDTVIFSIPSTTFTPSVVEADDDKRFDQEVTFSFLRDSDVPDVGHIPMRRFPYGPQDDTFTHGWLTCIPPSNSWREISEDDRTAAGNPSTLYTTFYQFRPYRKENADDYAGRLNCGFNDNWKYAVEVPNGYYDITMYIHSDLADDRGNHQGCVVNGMAPWGQREGSTTDAVTVLDFANQNERTARIKVTNGQIIIKDFWHEMAEIDSRYHNQQNTFRYRCENLSGFSVKRVYEKDNGVWMPAKTDAWWYTPVYNDRGYVQMKDEDSPDWERVQPPKVGVVSIDVVPSYYGAFALNNPGNRNYLGNRDWDCSEYHLFKEATCSARMNPSRGLVGERADPLSEGFIVGVSQLPCEDNDCYGEVCEHVMVGLTHRLQASGEHQRAVSYSNRYTVDCKGKQGKYVYIKLPGENRVMPQVNVTVSRAEFPDNYPIKTHQHVCYGIENRIPGETGTSAEYETYDDPTDDGFYGTCFQRERSVEFFPFSASDDGGAEEATFTSNVNNYCLECNSFFSHQNPAENIVYPWVFSDDGCYHCESQSVEALDTCPVPEEFDYVSYVIIPVSVAVGLILLIAPITAFCVCKNQKKNQKKREAALSMVRI